ncbi:MAG: hypothetical protein KatS3mg124_0326 [Porticoccaceae bacterium]|nr:MAG: hypothetical protein KatS3mg124_0326 [Porticoccaceae bacterium]
MSGNPSGASLESEEERRAGARVLLVEDEAIVAEDLAEGLAELGYEICGIADNGRQALALARAQRPDVVLMDIVLKGDLDGIETAQRLQSFADCPVIFATAYGDPATLARAARTTPYGYLVKPYDAHRARAAIEVALHKAELERRLTEAERWFTAALDCVADAVLTADAAGRVRTANPVAEELLGTPRAALEGRPLLEVLPFAGITAQRHPLQSLLSAGPTSPRLYFNLFLEREGKELLPVDLSVASIEGPRGRLGTVAVLRDARQRLEAQHLLSLDETRFQAIFDHSPNAMAMLDLEWRLLQGNAALAELLGWQREALAGTPFAALTSEIEARRVAELARRLYDPHIPHLVLDLHLCHQSGELVETRGTLSLLRRRGAAFAWLFQFHDLTPYRAYERDLLHLSHHDALTGLPNRALFLAELNAMLAALQREGRLALAHLDLDRFRDVNIALGLAVGDAVLEESAHRLVAAVAKDALVGRLGGDRFAVAVPGVADEAAALSLAGGLQRAIAEPLESGEHVVRCRASVGVALFPRDGRTAAELVRRADSALNAAKELGPGQIQCYRPEHTAPHQARFTLARQLGEALAQGQFTLHYQPVVELATGAVVGCEALLRWHHPEEGLLGPDRFLPLAEQEGLIVPLGDWVIMEACRAAARWNRGRSRPVELAVNLSPAQFAAGELPRVVRAALAESGLDPCLLTLELTEQLFLQDTEHNAAVIAALRDLGVNIALDDFGVGYSSLAYLLRFRPETLKIDRSFVATLPGNPEGEALVETILTIAARLGSRVVAEGIETAAQRDRLRALDCRLGQGFLFSTAVPEEELRSRLAGDWQAPT